MATQPTNPLEADIKAYFHHRDRLQEHGYSGPPENVIDDMHRAENRIRKAVGLAPVARKQKFN